MEAYFISYNSIYLDTSILHFLIYGITEVVFEVVTEVDC